MKIKKKEESYFDSLYHCLIYSFDSAIKKLNQDERYALMGYKNATSDIFNELNDSVQKLESAKLYFMKLYEKELEGLHND